jgi:hypothetical protein
VDELVQWLRAQLDEDEEEARRGYLKAEPLPDYDGWDKSTVAGLPPIVAARVLREIDAKRRLVERHAPHASGSVDCSMRCERTHPGVPVCNHDGRRWPCPDVIDATSVYADRPGYRENWLP